jgi:hypothetical protein
MLTIKEDNEGLWHWRYSPAYDDNDEPMDDAAELAAYESGEYILDEQGNKIPSTACLCFAKYSTECCCGCTSWTEDDYEDWCDYDSEDDWK